LNASDRKRVCFFNTTRFWGGGEKWTLEMALRLRQRGRHVAVIAYPGTPFFERATREGLDTAGFAISNRSGLNPSVFLRLKRFFQERATDTVIFNGPNDLKAGGLSARAAGVGQRVYQRGLAVHVRNQWLNRYLFRQVLTHIVANSEATKSAFLRDFAGVIPESDVRVIPLGIDVDRFEVSHRVKIGNEPQGIVLGSVGRLAAEKDHASLIHVAARLKQAGHSFTLHVAGEGALKDELEASTRALGVQREVNFLGFVDDIPTFLEGVDVFLLSSRWEGFGLAVVEAGAAGMPVVAFDTTSMPEVIAHGETGFLVEVGDVDAFAARVGELIVDPELRRRMGTAARKRVEERFRIERSIDDFEEYLWGPVADLPAANGRRA